MLQVREPQLRAVAGRLDSSRGGVAPLHSMAGLGLPALLGRPAHAASGVVAARESWLARVLERRAAQLAFASAGISVPNGTSSTSTTSSSSSAAPPTSTPVQGWGVGKGSGFHRAAGVALGGNSVHALLARLVVMETLEAKGGGFDSELMQEACLRVVSGGLLPEGYLPSYLAPLLESYARGSKARVVRADLPSGSYSESDSQSVAGLLLATPLILLALLSHDRTNLSPASRCEEDQAPWGEGPEEDQAGCLDGSCSSRHSINDLEQGHLPPWDRSFISTPRCARYEVPRDIAGTLHGPPMRESAGSREEASAGKMPSDAGRMCRPRLGQALRPPQYLPAAVQPLLLRFLDAFW
jgi:hypothetical protein